MIRPASTSGVGKISILPSADCRYFNPNLFLNLIIISVQGQRLCRARGLCGRPGIHWILAYRSSSASSSWWLHWRLPTFTTRNTNLASWSCFPGTHCFAVRSEHLMAEGILASRWSDPLLMFIYGDRWHNYTLKRVSDWSLLVRRVPYNEWRTAPASLSRLNFSPFLFSSRDFLSCSFVKLYASSVSPSKWQHRLTPCGRICSMLNFNRWDLFLKCLSRTHRTKYFNG